MIRDIVFDLGGVLIDWDPRYLFRDRLNGEPRRVERFLAAVCTPEWHAGLDAGGSFAGLTQDLASRHPEHAEWIRRYASDWPQMFAGEFAEPVARLERLLARGFKLHALSNYPAEHIGFLYRRFPFMSRFHTVVLSGLVGSMKPDEAVFDYLLARIEGRPCAFVDDRAENVAAARRCGIHAIHVTSGGGWQELEALTGI